MSNATYLWLIPALPMLAAGISALLPQRSRRPSAALAIGSMGLSFLLGSQSDVNHGNLACEKGSKIRRQIPSGSTVAIFHLLFSCSPFAGPLARTGTAGRRPTTGSATWSGPG